MQRTLSAVMVGLLCAACSRPYADIPPEPPRAYARAEYLLSDGQFDLAVAALQAYLSNSTNVTFRARGLYQLAVAQFNLGRFRDCLDTLRQLEAEYRDYSWAQVAALRGDAQNALGMHTESFLSWEEAWAHGNAADRLVLQQRLQPAADDLEDSEVRELDELLVVPAVHAMIDTRVAELPELPPIEVAMRVPPVTTTEEPPSEAPPDGFDASAAGGEDRPQPADEGLPPLGPYDLADLGAGEEVPLPDVPELRYDVGLVEASPEAQPPVEEPAGPAIASLLPLTGPDQTYGIRALSGLRLAVAGSPYRLLVRDTGGDPEQAAALIAQLAVDPDVLAVVGPLRSVEAKRLAPLAEKLELPLVLLSQRGRYTGRYVFQTAATRRQQVAAIVAYAVDRLGARQFGIFFPNDAYGDNFRDLFRDEIGRKRASLVGSRSYAPGQIEFSAEVLSAREWVRARGLDAVFIPDNARTAINLASELRIQMPDLQLIGSESWNRPAAIAETGSLLNGAVFADSFFESSARPTTMSFVERFREANQRIPTVFEAHAFDAGRLIVRAAEAGAPQRSEIAAQLRDSGRYDGAGSWHVSADGFDPELLVLRIQNGQIVETSGAPREEIGG